jgi:glutamate-1-semialdehyde 2,1-aminomutase
VQSYQDLLANDASLFTGYRLAQMEHGIFELPLNLKRSHVSYAHTDADVDRLLEATRQSIRTILRKRSAGG